MPGLLRHIHYYLVCHETRSKVHIGGGVHAYEYGKFDTQALTDFLSDNVLHPLVVERWRGDIAGYETYTNDEVSHD